MSTGLQLPETNAMPVTADAREGRPLRRGRAALVVLLALQVALWLTTIGAAGLFRAGPTSGPLSVDFRVFYTAAAVMKEGGNPYDYHTLARREGTLLHWRKPLTASEARLVRTGNPPLFYWLLEPLTDLPYGAVAAGWLALLTLCALGGCIVLLRALGWRRRWAPLIAFALMPQVVLSVAFGNVDCLVFLALGAAFAIGRRFPALAGALLAVGWLKPQLALPLALLLVLLDSARLRSYAAGFGAATAVLAALTLVTVGPHMIGLWVQDLLSWSRDVRFQPNIASLNGLYVAWAPRAGATIVQAVTLLLAAGLTVRWWRETRVSGRRTLLSSAYLWVVWFLASPYAHYPDEVLLTLPSLALLGQNGWRFATRAGIAYVYLFLISIVFFASFGSVNLLSLLLIVAAAILYVHRGADSASPRTVPAAPVAATAQ